MSFGFQAISAPETVQADRSVLRQLVEVELYEVSAVSFPAYAGTAIEVNSLRRRLGYATRESDRLLELLRFGDQVDRTTQRILEDLLGI
jgi:phage head maturation protease